MADSGVSTQDSGLDEVVGVRFGGREALTWYRAGRVRAGVGSWVVAEAEGAEVVGRVVVGRGQCLSFAGAPSGLPELLRAALPKEIPPSRRGAGQVLLESLPIEPTAGPSPGGKGSITGGT